MNTTQKAIVIVFLILCSGTLAITGVSHLHAIQWESWREGKMPVPPALSVAVYRGKMQCVYFGNPSGRDEIARWTWLGMSVAVGPLPNTGLRVHSIEFHAFLLVAVFGAYPVRALLLPSARRARRKGRGLCINCGYDLRGLVERRCPECAQPFATPLQKDGAVMTTADREE